MSSPETDVKSDEADFIIKFPYMFSLASPGLDKARTRPETALCHNREVISVKRKKKHIAVKILGLATAETGAASCSITGLPPFLKMAGLFCLFLPGLNSCPYFQS